MATSADNASTSPITASLLVSQKMPGPKHAISPWLSLGGAAIITGQNGIGKTYFAVTIATVAAAGGGDFLGWHIYGRQDIVYISVKHDPASIRAKFSHALATRQEEICPCRPEINYVPRLNSEQAQPIQAAKKQVLTIASLRGVRLRFLQPEGRRAQLEAILTGLSRDSLVILDDASAFEREREGIDWDDVLRWAAAVQKTGSTLLLLNDTRRDDTGPWNDERAAHLQTVLLLKKYRKYQREDYPGCQVQFEYSRGLVRDDARAFIAFLGCMDPHQIVPTWTRTEL